MNNETGAKAVQQEVVEPPEHVKRRARELEKEIAAFTDRWAQGKDLRARRFSRIANEALDLMYQWPALTILTPMRLLPTEPKSTFEATKVGIRIAGRGVHVLRLHAVVDFLEGDEDETFSQEGV